MKIEITSVELIDLKVLRDRLDRERRESHTRQNEATSRSNSADRDYEAVERVVRRAEAAQ